MKFNEQAQVFHKQQIATLLMLWFIFMFQFYRYCFTAISHGGPCKNFTVKCGPQAEKI